MTPLTWLTIFYQAACRQYHMHSVDNHSEDLVSGSSGCLLRRDSENADDEVENTPESSSGESTCVEKQQTSCGCSDCFLHVPQYSKQAYLQIVRVSFQLLNSSQNSINPSVLLHYSLCDWNSSGEIDWLTFNVPIVVVSEVLLVVVVSSENSGNSLSLSGASGWLPIRVVGRIKSSCRHTKLGNFLNLWIYAKNLPSDF